MAKRRAISSPERPVSRSGAGFKIMTEPNGRPDGRRTQQKEHALVEMSSAYLVGDMQEYYARPYCTWHFCCESDGPFVSNYR
jgi:hypothetical protein